MAQGKSETPVAPTEVKSRKINIEVVRKNGTTSFKFAVNPFITEIYKSQSAGIKESSSWPGNKFYSVPTYTQSEAYKALLRNYGLYDDYGHPLINSERSGGPLLNIAWLRTVEGSGEIQITDPLSVADLSRMVKNASQFIKEYFTEYFQEAKITGSVTLEL